jgi:hypothetical protein
LVVNALLTYRIKFEDARTPPEPLLETSSGR